VVQLTSAQEKIVSEFLSNLSQDGQRGLWVFGPRKSGTSTIARTAALNAYDTEGAVDLSLPPGRKISAVELTDLQRKLWSQEELLRANGKDISLWVETQSVLDEWDAVWASGVLWVDDILTVDVEFWKKHILARLDLRLKGRGVTILSGVIGPQAFGSDWRVGFEYGCQVVRVQGHGEG
jgi:hypothetical protein